MAEIGGEREDRPATAHHRLEVCEVGEVTVVRLLTPAISDASTAQDVSEELVRLAEEANRAKLLLDLSAVEILAPAGVAKFLLFAKKVKAHGGQLRLAGVRPTIYDVFVMNRLTGFFEFARDEAEGLASF